MSTVIFRNGAVFDGRKYAGAGAVVVEDGRVAAVLTGRDLDKLDHRSSGPITVLGVRSRTHRHRPQGRPDRPRLRGRARPRRPGRARADPVRPDGAAHPRGVPRRHRGVRRRPPRAAVDPRRRVGDGGVPGRHPAGRRPRRGRARPAGVPAQPRPPRGVGQQPGARARGHHERTPDPPHGRIERDADGRPTGTLHEGAMLAVSRHAPTPTPTSTTPRCSPARPTSTRWASPAGRTPSSATTPAWTTPARSTGGPPATAT